MISDCTTWDEALQRASNAGWPAWHMIPSMYSSVSSMTSLVSGTNQWWMSHVFGCLWFIFLQPCGLMVAGSAKEICGWKKAWVLSSWDLRFIDCYGSWTTQRKQLFSDLKVDSWLMVTHGYGSSWLRKWMHYSSVDSIISPALFDMWEAMYSIITTGLERLMGLAMLKPWGVEVVPGKRGAANSSSDVGEFRGTLLRLPLSQNHPLVEARS